MKNNSSTWWKIIFPCEENKFFCTTKHYFSAMKNNFSTRWKIILHMMKHNISTRWKWIFLHHEKIYFWQRLFFYTMKNFSTHEKYFCTRWKILTTWCIVFLHGEKFYFPMMKINFLYNENYFSDRTKIILLHDEK